MKAIPELVRRTGNVLIVVLFAGMLSLPLASSLIGFAPSPSLQEKRLRAEAPEFKFKGSILAKFPAKFEAYFNDNFPFRDQLVLWHNFVKVRGLKISPCPNVVIGENGWLYYQEGLLDHNHAIAPFTDEQLGQWVQLLEERQEWLAMQGIRHVIVIAPDKHTVYPEYLPGWVKNIGLSPRLDQFLAYARAHSDLTIIDLREPLCQAKEQELVYFRTDTHWNYRGAFIGDRCIAETLSHWYPQVHPLSRSAFLSASRSCTGDMATMLALPWFASLKDEDLLLEPCRPSRLRLEYNPNPAAGKPDWVGEIPDPDLPKAVVFHDSFGCALMPYLSEHFRRVVYNAQGREIFDTLLIDREKPDVVISEFVERRLANDALPYNPGTVIEALKYKNLREKFAGTRDILLALSNPGTGAGIDVSAQVAASSGPTGLVLQVPDQQALLLLPSCTCDPQSSLLVRLDLTSPEDAVMNVFYQTDKAPLYSAERQIDRSLHKGRNVVYLEVPGPGLTGRLRLDPGRVTGQYILHGVEIRGQPLEKAK